MKDMTIKRVLMVEGPDDEHVVKNICGKYHLGNIDSITPYGGKDTLIGAINVRLKESDIDALGIILDADEDLHARWQSLSDRLKVAGYQGVPSVPASDGTVILPPQDALLPKVGVWLMPDNKVPGIMEDFLRFLIPPNDDLLPYAQASIDGLPKPTRFSELKKPKALVHTWLAWQEEPGKPFGQAISSKYFDHSLPMGVIFAGWLQRTFFCEIQGAVG